MKKILYLFSLPAFLILLSCGSGSRYNENDSDEMNDSIDYYEEEVPQNLDRNPDMDPGTDPNMDGNSEPAEEPGDIEDLQEEISENEENN